MLGRDSPGKPEFMKDMCGMTMWASTPASFPDNDRPARYIGSQNHKHRGIATYGIGGNPVYERQSDDTEGRKQCERKLMG